MKVRLRQSYRGYARGRIMDFAPRVADVLVSAGIAERYVAPPAYEAKVIVPEAKVVEPEAPKPKRRYRRRDMKAGD